MSRKYNKVGKGLVDQVTDQLEDLLKEGKPAIIELRFPSDASVEEVKEIFNYEGCKPIGTIRSDSVNTW